MGHKRAHIRSGAMIGFRQWVLCFTAARQSTKGLTQYRRIQSLNTRSYFNIAFKKMFFAVRGASSRATFCLSLAREDAPRTSAKNSFS
jgi:hypothetical protein